MYVCSHVIYCYGTIVLIAISQYISVLLQWHTIPAVGGQCHIVGNFRRSIVFIHNLYYPGFYQSVPNHATYVVVFCCSFVMCVCDTYWYSISKQKD